MSQLVEKLHAANQALGLFTPGGESDVDLMRKLKHAWDPNDILNPGKVFDNA